MTTCQQFLRTSYTNDKTGRPYWIYVRGFRLHSSSLLSVVPRWECRDFMSIDVPPRQIRICSPPSIIIITDVTATVTTTNTIITIIILNITTTTIFRTKSDRLSVSDSRFTPSTIFFKQTFKPRLSSAIVSQVALCQTAKPSDKMLKTITSLTVESASIGSIFSYIYIFLFLLSPVASIRLRVFRIQPLTIEVRHRETRWAQWYWQRVFSELFGFFPVCIFPPMTHAHMSFIYH